MRGIGVDDMRQQLHDQWLKKQAEAQQQQQNAQPQQPDIRIPVEPKPAATAEQAQPNAISPRILEAERMMREGPRAETFQEMNATCIIRRLLRARCVLSRIDSGMRCYRSAMT